MDAPILKRRDLIKIKSYRNLRIYHGRLALNSDYCLVIGQKHRGKERYEEVYAYHVLIGMIKEVHRPTEAGLVQVWPEVKS